MWQVEQQRTSGDLPYVKDAFHRLVECGYSDKAILEMCLWVLATEYFRMLAHKEPWDTERYGRGLNRLPVMPWEDDGSDYPTDVTQKEVRRAILDNPGLLLETSEQTRERYLRVRSKLKEIQKLMTPLMDPAVFRASAQSLGVLKDNTIVADCENVLDVVADHCIYANPKHRRKLLKTYRSHHSKSIDSDCREILCALENARYAVMFCDEVLPGLGLQMKNLLTGEVIQLIDINMAETVERGVVICSHIIAPYGMFMTTGSPLPIPTKAAITDVSGIIEEYINHDRLRPDGIRNDDGEFAAQIVSTLLRRGVMNYTAFE